MWPRFRSVTDCISRTESVTSSLNHTTVGECARALRLEEEEEEEEARLLSCNSIV